MSNKAHVKCERLGCGAERAVEGLRQKAQPIRVLYCILDNRFGGPHRRALTMAECLRKHGVETVFLTGCKTQDSWRPENFELFPCRNIQCISRYRPMRNLARFSARLPRTIAEIRRLIATEGIDIVHIDGVTNVVPALAAKRSGVPIVWTYNDHPPALLKPFLQSLVGALASHVIVQGEPLRQARTSGHPKLRDKTTVLHSAVDISRFVPEGDDAAQRRRIRSELAVPPDGILVGTVGNVNRFKGHTYLLEAAARVARLVNAVRFAIVGRKLDTDAAYWRDLQQLAARLGLTDRVVFTGFREDIPAVLSALDVFVLPSVLESCPVAVLEAMAMEVPVVATDVGAIRDLVTHRETGFLVPARNTAALSDAILAVLRMPSEEVSAMTQAALERVEQKFGVETIAAQQLQMYKSVRRPDVSQA